MSFGWYTVGINSAKEGLDPLLPHIAGVIENMEEATVTDIKSQIEKDMNENVSKSAILGSLENGIRLGLFHMEREFKVCREFTSKEMEKVDMIEQKVVLPKEAETDKPSLMDYVKMQREKRRRKMYKAKGLKQTVLGRGFRDRDDMYSQLCQRCRKSIEKKLTQCGKSSDISSDNENRNSMTYKESMSESSHSDVSNLNSRSSENDRKIPEKSRLLVEKNPMETDPPYCDIFT